eukprot:1148563-Pelagomonas_calceolata.AAC.2
MEQVAEYLHTMLVATGPSHGAAALLLRRCESWGHRVGAQQLDASVYCHRSFKALGLGRAD